MADEHIPLADPNLADGHPRQVAHELLTAVGLGFVFYGPGDAVSCFQSFLALAPALRDTDGHNGGSYLGVLRGRPGIFWLAFEGPHGSAIAVCVTSDADTEFVTNHIAMRLRDARAPWRWGICTGGNVPAGCTRILDTADVIELHALPGLQHIPADASGALPTDLVAGLTARGWEPAGNGLRKDFPLIGRGVQPAFVFSRHNQTFGIVTQIGTTTDGVVPEQFRRRQEEPYLVEAAGDLVLMCQPIGYEHPTATTEYVDAAARVLVARAAAPHFPLGNHHTPSTPPQPQTAPISARQPDSGQATTSTTAAPGSPPQHGPSATTSGRVRDAAAGPRDAVGAVESRRSTVLLAGAALAVVVLVLLAIVLTNSGGSSSPATSPSGSTAPPRVDQVAVCNSTPTFSPQSANLGTAGLSIDTRITPACAAGDLLANSRLQVDVIDGSGRSVAAGLFDTASAPLTAAPGGSTATLIFPAGTYWRTPGPADQLRMTITRQGTDQTPTTGTLGASSITAAAVGTPATGTVDEAAQSALSDLAAEDRVAIDASLLEVWQPQLSSKRTGLVADGITWSASDIMREHMQLRQRFPGARLLWSGDWPVFSSPTWWVTVAGVPFAGGDQANGWCTSEGFDADHCFAKLLSHNRGSSGTTIMRR
ncbi:hypothetical protein ACJEIK_28375 [Mycobacterium sp. SMC-16]|uniref:hypothetical protein n=1 Tax=Mycobacterium sp. SMC-16 TaxID=3385967 RepID=UPI00390C7237